MSTTDNPFATADAWGVSTLLPVGNHVVTIDDLEDASTKAGDPQVHLTLKNQAGSIQDWVFYRADFLGKVVALFDAASIERPGPGEYDPTTFRLSGACLARLGGKQVGIVVRDEEKFGGSPGETTRKVQGYIKPEEIGSAPAPAPASTFGNGVQQTGKSDLGGGGKAFGGDDIPFAWDGPREFESRYHQNRVL